jgi:sugar-specific transcriptional regulator TrmB
MLEKYLQEIGLSEKESQVYLALLQVDNESIQDLAKRTGINRTTVYPVLETLEKKGLVSEVQVGKKTHYEAAAPERLETFVERQKVVLEERSLRLKDIIPQIKSVQREEGERPLVKFFDGRDGTISAMEEFFGTEEKEGEAYFFYSRDLLDKNFTQQEKDRYLKMRLDRKIKSESIYTFSKGDLGSDSNANRLQIDGNKFPITCDIAVYKDTVRVTTLGNTVSSILIRSKDFAETLTSLFRLVKDKPQI